MQGFLDLLSEGDGSGACDLLTSGAQAQAVAAPGADCAAGLIDLTGGDDAAKRAAIKDSSFSVDADETTATATVGMPDPQLAVGSGTRTVTLGMQSEAGKWLISDINSLCVAKNVPC